jgi:hypothetical protein
MKYKNRENNSAKKMRRLMKGYGKYVTIQN